ncbi:hypothetical protein GRZ55_13770 [Chelativorans sp. ZYF759]|uniref:hypothetical protein n=1 Tax=Chelativorans sp. ZYF759 TaxID=2692213 RepID=UPI00145D5038|nr:hypothetical protein [Chelativorans sp. ZYF759]NMG40313.1 hypothetical protein [Chelativorans sp. ZYF759]
MIKFALAALWIIAVTTGTVLFAYQSAGTDPETEQQATYFGGLDYVQTEVISVPVLKNNEVHGYFLARLVYTAEAEKLHRMVMPPEAIIFDEVYSYLFGNELIDFSGKETFDLDAFRNGIKDSINRRVGEDLVREILVEQMDFLTKADIRNSMMRGFAGSEM